MKPGPIFKLQILNADSEFRFKGKREWRSSTIGLKTGSQLELNLQPQNRNISDTSRLSQSFARGEG
jgi:hypothetical protein